MNFYKKENLSLIELNKKYGNRKSFFITSILYYALLFCLLSVYFSGLTDNVSFIFNLNKNLVLVGCGIFLVFFLHFFDNKIFSSLSSIFVIIFVCVIFCAIFKIGFAIPKYEVSLKVKEFPNFFLILFTSFGMQHIAPFICQSLNYDKKLTQKAFLSAILVTGVIYILWISCSLQKVAQSPEILNKLQTGTISTGEFVQFLCDSSSSKVLSQILQMITFFAIVTSMIGVGLGIKHALQPKLGISSYLLIFLIPIFANLFIPNVFLNILAFGGLICTILYIFIPFYLVKKNIKEENLWNGFLLTLGLILVLCEFYVYCF
jgi:amino acid permease